MSGTLAPSDLAEVADSLRELLSQIDGGQLVASSATAHRMEGALAAIELALGEQAVQSNTVLGR